MRRVVGGDGGGGLIIIPIYMYTPSSKSLTSHQLHVYTKL